MPAARSRSCRLPCALGVAAALGLAAALGAGGDARAHSYGAPSTIFRDTRPRSCNGCHRGGVAPEVTVAASAPALAAAAPVILTVTVTTPNGDPGAAGFD